MLAAAAPAPDVEELILVDVPLDLRLTLAPLAHGTGDPTMRLAPDGVWLAQRTAAGAATLHLARLPDGIRARAWGPGAERAIAAVPALVGLRDEPERLRPAHPRLAAIARRHPGLRLPSSGRPFDALLPAICEQKITGDEARRAYRAIVRRHGEPAPGVPGLLLPPAPETLAALPYHAFHPLGIERRRAEVIRRAASLAPRLVGTDAATAGTLLRSVAGIGPWTVAEVLRVSHGDPDAVSVGDYHIPSLVAWVLAGERRATDERMLELLQPYAGQRGRVQRLLEVGAAGPPRRGPRMPSRDISRY